METDQIEELIRRELKLDNLRKTEVIQELWSSYGEISRYSSTHKSSSSLIVKRVNPPKKVNHPKGWNTQKSHQRKLKSYQVEMTWYEHFGPQCDEDCKVPQAYLLKRVEEGQVFVLEDLDAAGFNRRKESLTIDEIKVCIRWLANFHARFMGKSADGLWKQGTYWHIDRRSDELEALKDHSLKNKAHAINQLLDNCEFQTIIHGDAKVANFCFTEDLSQVAAVDFQYVGGGCGMKDLAYLMSSCFDSKACQTYEAEVLAYYFSELELALKRNQQEIDFKALKLEWTKLYSYAWADFIRFLKGWSPEHWKLNQYSENILLAILQELEE